MAENVLGTLFQNIADAIRSKTGDSASMKPSEFPEKINGITAGEGGGTGTNGTFTLASGSFYATDSIMTVEHNLGYVPDILFFVATAPPAVGMIYFGIGYSKAFYSSLEGHSSKGFNVGIISESGGGMTWSAPYSMEEDHADALDRGNIRECNATSFVVGGTIFKLNSTTNQNGYTWYAISGITG